MGKAPSLFDDHTDHMWFTRITRMNVNASSKFLRTTSLLLVCSCLYFFAGHFRLSRGPIRTTVASYAHLADHCASVAPISAEEFHHRQTSLANALHLLNASAYIAEPGANAEYFSNISNRLWRLSERPLLLVIAPEHTDDGIRAKVSVVTPSFEAKRAKLLPVSANNVTFAEWPEDANPYEVAVSTFKHGTDTIFVDDSIRHFIVDGIKSASSNSSIISAPLEIRQLRERKSTAELNLLRCANEVTLLAVREVRENMYIGIRESETRSMIHDALSAAGLVGTDAIVLFGENAALPHGSGTDRALGEHDFALIDCGGGLHGYRSDLTRTFALHDSFIESDRLSVWFTVRAAQKTASLVAWNGTLTRDVDEGARGIIDAAGYGEYFTHRLGHGIGLEVHEAPYLRGGSNDIIKTGNAFSNEPGIYIEGKLGVRLEDCFYISEEGSPVFFTKEVGGPSTSPWRP